MRKCYVVLATEKRTNRSWVVGIYSSMKKAKQSQFIHYVQNFANLNEYKIITEVLL